MRNRLSFVLIAFVLVISSCHTTYFDTPNDLRNMYGTVYLMNGKSYEGKIVVNKSSLLSSPVKLYTEGDKKPMQFRLLDVKGYKIRNDYFALKEIKGSINLARQYSFMRRLTPEDSRIALYENIEKVTRTTSNNTRSTHYETEYFMELPFEEGDQVWSLSSSKFVPNFDEKMSKIVSDCPMVARKIANREEGYFYRQVTVFKDRRADVLLNIIEEYNRCQ